MRSLTTLTVMDSLSKKEAVIDVRVDDHGVIVLAGYGWVELYTYDRLMHPTRWPLALPRPGIGGPTAVLVEAKHS